MEDGDGGAGFQFFVHCQRLIARNVANGFLLNRGISHCYEACRIDYVSRGFVLRYEILTILASVYHRLAS